MPPPGFGDGFADRWFATEEGIKELLGQGGPGAPGVLESWRDLAKDTGERLTNPLGAAVGDVKDALNSPSPAYYLGEKSADAAVAAPGLIFGGEGAVLGRGAALDDLAAGGVPHQLIDHPTPIGAVDHPAPLGGDGYHTPAVEGTGSQLPAFDLGGGPALADAGHPEFTLSNPLAHLSPELRGLAEQHLTGSGETVLGPYRPDGGGPSYIEVAQQQGAQLFRHWRCLERGNSHRTTGGQSTRTRHCDSKW